MTKNLFDSNIVPACSYCVYGTAASAIVPAAGFNMIR